MIVKEFPRKWNHWKIEKKNQSFLLTTVRRKSWFSGTSARKNRERRTPSASPPCMTEVRVTNGQRLKPQIIVIYDHTKGGVDIVDLISCHHSKRMKSKRWPLTTFTFVLDTIRRNSKTFLEDNKKILNNFEFTYQLEKVLVLPKMQQRLKNSNGLQIGVFQKVRRVLRLPEVNRKPLPDAETAITSTDHCHKCVESAVGTKTYKKDHEKLNNKLKTKCHVCSFFICKKHQHKLELTCEDCFE